MHYAYAFAFLPIPQANSDAHLSSFCANRIAIDSLALTGNHLVIILSADTIPQFHEITNPNDIKRRSVKIISSVKTAFIDQFRSEGLTNDLIVGWGTGLGVTNIFSPLAVFFPVGHIVGKPTTLTNLRLIHSFASRDRDYFTFLVTAVFKIYALLIGIAWIPAFTPGQRFVIVALLVAVLNAIAAILRRASGMIAIRDYFVAHRDRVTAFCLARLNRHVPIASFLVLPKAIAALRAYFIVLGTLGADLPPAFVQFETVPIGDPQCHKHRIDKNPANENDQKTDHRHRYYILGIHQSAGIAFAPNQISPSEQKEKGRKDRNHSKDNVIRNAPGHLKKIANSAGMLAGSAARNKRIGGRDNGKTRQKKHYYQKN
jgi:hypothetical protein